MFPRSLSFIFVSLFFAVSPLFARDRAKEAVAEENQRHQTALAVIEQARSRVTNSRALLDKASSSLEEIALWATEEASKSETSGERKKYLNYAKAALGWKLKNQRLLNKWDKEISEATDKESALHTQNMSLIKEFVEKKEARLAALDASYTKEKSTLEVWRQRVLDRAYRDGERLKQKHAMVKSEHEHRLGDKRGWYAERENARFVLEANEVNYQIKMAQNRKEKGLSDIEKKLEGLENRYQEGIQKIENSAYNNPFDLPNLEKTPSVKVTVWQKWIPRLLVILAKKIMFPLKP